MQKGCAPIITALGIVGFKAGNRMKVEDTAIDPRQRTDTIEVNWV